MYEIKKREEGRPAAVMFFQLERALTALDWLGDRTVAVASADIARQAVALGLLDAIAVDLVPVLLGSGTPFFAGLQLGPVVLDTPTVVEGSGVTHLTYRVRRAA